MDNKLNQEYLEFLLAEIIKSDQVSTAEHFYNQFKSFAEKDQFIMYLESHTPKTKTHLSEFIQDKLNKKGISLKKAAQFLSDFELEKEKSTPETIYIQYDAMIHRLLLDIGDMSQKVDILSLSRGMLLGKSKNQGMCMLINEHLIALEMVSQFMLITGFHQKKIGGIIQMVFDSNMKLKINRKIFVLNKCIFYMSGMTESTLIQFMLSTIHSFKLALTDSTSSPGRVPETFAQKWKEMTTQFISIFDHNQS